MEFKKLFLVLLSSSSSIYRTLASDNFTPLTTKQQNYCNFISINTDMNLDSCFKKSSNDMDKTLMALYQLQKYFDDGNMKDFCSKSSNYGKYIEDKNKDGFGKKYYEEDILPFILQRRYLCTQYDSGEYCDPTVIKYDYDHLNKRIDSICVDNTRDVCDEAFVNLASNLNMASIDDYEVYENNVSCDGNKKDTLLITKVNHMRDDLHEKVRTVCTRKPTVTEKKITTNKSEPKKSLSICGKGIGSCSDGECCSKYGMCGTTSDYCKVKVGCQEKYGYCLESLELPISTTGRCSEKDGRCPSGECCSKHGWCGKSSDYCDVPKGCQTKFGICSGKSDDDEEPIKDLPVSTNHKCNEKDGKCPSGQCCSNYGWCGKGSDYCEVKKGCQSEFGMCNDDIEPIKDLPISTNDKCGEKYGQCPEGKCCSKYGWCGKSSDHCSIAKGCQTKFGGCSN